MYEPKMRVRNIACDTDEMPTDITVEMTEDVRRALDGRFGDTSVVARNGMWRVTITIGAAADIARWAGRVVGSEQTAATTEAYECLVGSVFNRFWEDGVDGYEAGVP